MIETQFILPIDSLKDFPPLLDPSVQESFKTAKNDKELLDTAHIQQPNEEVKEAVDMLSEKSPS